MPSETSISSGGLRDQVPSSSRGSTPGKAGDGTPGTRLDLASLMPHGWVGGLLGQGEPEVKKMTFGILPLSDCAPIVIAHERGFFAQAGLQSVIARRDSWTTLRDSLNSGEVQAAQMLFGMPIAAAVDRLGYNQKPLVVPWILSRNGQGITLAAKHAATFADPAAFRSMVLERRDRGRPVVFGMTLACGTHAMWLRYWLGSLGIDPDRDVALITIPPPQMVSNLRLGRMDGFCVGEPWNAKAVEDKLGFTAALSEEIWPHHPEKVLAITEEFAETNPQTVKAVLKALHEASLWCDDSANHPELARVLSASHYVNASAETIQARLGKNMDCGNGHFTSKTEGVVFHGRNTNYPQLKYAVWWLAQMRRWNMLLGAPDYLGIATRVLRPDFYEAAMKEIGVVHGGIDLAPETLCDGIVFDPSEPEQYAASFPLSSLRSAAPTL